MTEDEARVFIGGELCIKKAEELVVGDVVLLDSGTYSSDDAAAVFAKVSTDLGMYLGVEDEY